MANSLWKDYLALLTSLSQTLEKLTAIERQKTDAVCQGNLPKVEDCMKQEQVFSLSLRSLEQKRIKLLSQLGLDGVNLRHLQEHAPEEYDLETKQVVEELRRQYTLFQAASQVARTTLECNLREIERIQQAQSDTAPGEQLPRQTDFRV